jgi:hypothetical protein
MVCILYLFYQGIVLPCSKGNSQGPIAQAFLSKLSIGQTKKFYSITYASQRVGKDLKLFFNLKIIHFEDASLDGATTFSVTTIHNDILPNYIQHDGNLQTIKTTTLRTNRSKHFNNSH